MFMYLCMLNTSGLSCVSTKAFFPPEARVFFSIVCNRSATFLKKPAVCRVTEHLFHAECWALACLKSTVGVNML